MLVQENDELYTAQDAGFSSWDRIDDLGDGLFRVCRKVTHQCGRTRRVKFLSLIHI